MRATTDSNPAVDYETAGPGILNLLAIYQAFSGADDDAMSSASTACATRFEEAGGRHGDLAPRAFPAALPPDRFRRWIPRRAFCARAPTRGPIANGTVKLVKERMGLYVSATAP